MSASSCVVNLIQVVDEYVVDYINTVSTKYGINKSELSDLWFLNTTKVSTKTGFTPPSYMKADNGVRVEDKKECKPLESNAELNKLSKNELIAHCKSRSLKTTGTKIELIERLTGTTQDPAKSKTSSVSDKPKSTPNTVVKQTPLQKKDKEAAQAEGVKGLFQVKPVAYKIVKNEFGSFWHAETRLVYDRDLKKFYGKQNLNGRIENMTEEDIETCNKYKFPFVMPDNLSKTEKITVTELDEDDLVGDDEELVDEELVDEEEPLVDEE
jgi:hypothetical protein